MCCIYVSANIDVGAPMANPSVCYSTVIGLLVKLEVILFHHCFCYAWYFIPDSYINVWAIFQFIPLHPISSRSILILSTHLCLVLLSLLCAFHAHFILLDLIHLIILGREYKLWGSLLCSFLHAPVTSSLFDPNIPHSLLFSNALSLFVL
jgi:hypothetical protein